MRNSQILFSPAWTSFLERPGRPDVWMKDCGTHYNKYAVCVYVDNLAVMMKESSDFFANLKVWKYELKGVGEISHHLGGDFFRDPDGTLAWGAKTYCKRVVQQCTSILGAPP